MKRNLETPTWRTGRCSKSGYTLFLLKPGPRVPEKHHQGPPPRSPEMVQPKDEGACVYLLAHGNADPYSLSQDLTIDQKGLDLARKHGTDEHLSDAHFKKSILK